MLKAQMDNIYKNIALPDIPWNTEKPPKLLLEFVKNEMKKPSKVIELGCGAGNYVTYLASLGFTATGVDFSEKAIEIAINSSKAKKLDCKFIIADVVGDLLEVQDKYDFAYDWELLHHIFPENRKKYINNVYRILKPGGKYFSVCFSEENTQFGGKGKYRKTPLNTVLYFSSENELVSLFESFFKIE